MAEPAGGATTTVTDGWGRNRLLAILASAGVVALTVAVGFIYAVYLAINSAGARQSTEEQSILTVDQMNSDTALGRKHRDQVAAQPMLVVPQDAMKPTTPTTQLPETIAVPEATNTGSDGVASGFPHTPQGAVGQLAAMSQTVLTSMSVATAHQIYDDWAMPGGVGPNSWQMTANVTSFLGAAGMGQTKAPGATVAVIPAAAQVKGTDGPDWTVACVLFEIDATLTSQSSIGYGYCERMQWNPDADRQADTAAGGRWRTAPGTPPAPAPSTWPGSALALRAGWRTWTTIPSSGPSSGPTSGPSPGPSPGPTSGPTSGPMRRSAQ